MTDVIEQRDSRSRRSRHNSLVLLYAGLATALLLVLFLSMASGRYYVPLDQVIAILISHVVDVGSAFKTSDQIVVDIVRAPRVLTAAIAGAGLATSGAVLQGMFRNPLVGPQTIGVASGAAVGGVTAILFAGFGPLVQLGAFAGAAIALLLVLAIARSDGLPSVLTLVLAGVVVNAFCAALVGLATYVADPETKLPDIVFWLLGSFAASTWDRLWLIAVATAIATAILFGMRWRINVLSLGDEEARTLGVNPPVDRLIALAAACLAISGQVAISGTIGWVGLIIPNLARLVVGSDHRHLLPVSALAGAIFLALADTIARTLTASEIPVGIITAIVGTPVFAVMVRRGAGARLP
jgi:iron complex transport system permease protein